MNKKQIKEYIKAIEREIQESVDKRLLTYSLEKCFGCNESDPTILVDHHIDWQIINGKAKSNKLGKIIKLCFNCHHKIHNKIPMGIDIDDESLTVMVNKHLEANNTGDATTEINNFLGKVAVARFKTKNLLEEAAFSFINLSKEVKT